MGTRRAAMDRGNGFMTDSHYIIDANHNVASSSSYSVQRNPPIGPRHTYEISGYRLQMVQSHLRFEDSHYIIDEFHSHIVATTSYRVRRNRPQNAAIPIGYHNAPSSSSYGVRRNRPARHMHSGPPPPPSAPHQYHRRQRHINGPRLRHVPMENIEEMSYEEFLALGERVGNVSTGLSDEAITTQMKTRLFVGASKDQEENDCCVICQDEYSAQEEVGVLRCGHEYHASCLRKWLQMKNICPLCKSEALMTQ